jgi:hypothetical protein
MTVIERRECQACGMVDVTTMSHVQPKAGPGPSRRYHGPVVSVKYVPASQLEGAVARADAAEGRISLAERRLQFAFERAGIEVDAQALEGFVKHAAQHVGRARS